MASKAQRARQKQQEFIDRLENLLTAFSRKTKTVHRLRITMTDIAEVDGPIWANKKKIELYWNELGTYHTRLVHNELDNIPDMKEVSHVLFKTAQLIEQLDQLADEMS